MRTVLSKTLVLLVMLEWASHRYQLDTNLILTGIRRQWREHSRSVRWEYLRRLKIRWAAAFKMSCNDLRCSSEGEAYLVINSLFCRRKQLVLTMVCSLCGVHRSLSNMTLRFSAFCERWLSCLEMTRYCKSDSWPG